MKYILSLPGNPTLGYIKCPTNLLSTAEGRLVLPARCALPQHQRERVGQGRLRAQRDQDEHDRQVLLRSRILPRRRVGDQVPALG